jgi:hypothetical protein
MFWRRRKLRERELDREIRNHLEMEAREQREFGLSEDQARYSAQRALGNTTLIKENVRETWFWTGFDALKLDFRYGAKMLLRRPAFSVFTIQLLALVIGASTILFSIADAVWFRPLPYRDPGQIVAVWEKPPRNVQWKRQTLAFNDFLDLEKNNHTFERLAAASPRRYTLRVNNRPESVVGEAITAGYLAMLGTAPLRGRTFLPTENRGALEVVLSYHGDRTRW